MRIMAKAMWEGAVLAESSQTVEVEATNIFRRRRFAKSISGPANCTRIVHGRGRQVTTTWRSTESGTPERRGITLSQRRRRNRLRGTWRSGKA